MRETDNINTIHFAASPVDYNKLGKKNRKAYIVYDECKINIDQINNTKCNQNRATYQEYHHTRHFKPNELPLYSIIYSIIYSIHPFKLKIIINWI